MAKGHIPVPDELKAFLEVEDCSDFDLKKYFITQDNQMLFDTIVREKKLGDQLRERFHISYLNTMLMYGLPGTGKTTFARYVACVLNIDFAYINFAKMMGGYGDANRIISDIFRYMTQQECVFLLDEIDCIARKRSKEGSDTAITMAANTITVMQELDYMKRNGSKAIILAATNRADTLDDALLSRFSVKHEMLPLDNITKEKYIMQFVKDTGIPFREDDVRQYCARNSRLEQRNMEADVIQGIAKWLEEGEKGYLTIQHIK